MNEVRNGGGGHRGGGGARAALDIGEQALSGADERTRTRAERAYITASHHEVDFFDQADRRF